MKAYPAIIQKMVFNVWVTGQSLTAVARICDVPVGTVKAWRSRGGWKRAENPRSVVHETTASAEKRGTDATLHRGLRWQHMPGRPGGKMATFALFRRGLWPPRQWRVPKELEGGALLLVLHERACAGQERKLGRGGR